MKNVADLVNQKDPEKRTWREINNSTKHSFQINTLVELDNLTRLYIAELTRDCDGTPMYSLTPFKVEGKLSHFAKFKAIGGYTSDDFKKV